MIPTSPWPIRLSHALNGVVLVVLIGSGLQIFNAHPALYASDASDPAHIVLSLEQIPFGLGGWLAGARRMHFMAALFFIFNGLLYLGVMLASGRYKAVWPERADLKRLGPALRDHLRLPPVLAGQDGGFNPLQKLSYFGVAALLGPFVVATGLALSPQWDALVPFWTDLFGGRQFARTWHFAAMAGLVGFTFMHVVMVLLHKLGVAK
jgi:thiosulfate reductase cytochrome b subunit